MTRRRFRRSLAAQIAGFGGPPYVFADRFTATLAAGSINNTKTEDENACRVVTDTESKISQTGGNLVFAGGKASPAWGDPGLWFVKPDCTSEWDRVAGRTFGVAFSYGAGSDFQVGYDIDTTGELLDAAFKFVSGTGLQIISAGLVISTVAASVAASTNYKLYTMSRAIGAYHYAFGGDFGTTVPIRVGVNDVIATATVTAGISNYDGAITISDANMRDIAVDTPLLSDTYSTTGTSDGLVTPIDVAGAGAGVVYENALNCVANKGFPTVVPGANVALNNDFLNWSGVNDLDDWTEGIIANTDLTQVDSGALHGGASGTGGSVNFYNNGGALLERPYILQSVGTIGDWIRATAIISAYGSGQPQFLVGVLTLNMSASTGTHTITSRISASTNLGLRNNSNPGDWTADSVSFQPLALADILYLADLSEADAFSIVYCTITDATQFGRAVCWDSQTSPANGILAYCNMVDAKIYLDKCVAGTWTTVASAAFTYSAGTGLQVFPANDSKTKWSVTYNGTNIINAAAISDAGIISNTLHGVFGTDTASYAQNDRIWKSQNATVLGVV